MKAGSSNEVPAFFAMKRVGLPHPFRARNDDEAIHVIKLLLLCP